MAASERPALGGASQAGEPATTVPPSPDNTSRPPRLTTVVDLRQVAESDQWWHSVAHRAVAWWASSGRPFDAYDVTLLGVPDPDHPARWGALFAACRAEGLITAVGYRASRRPSRSGGVCRVWTGAAGPNAA